MKRAAIAAAALVAVAAGIGVYGMAGPAGNAPGGACEAGSATAARLDPLIRGEVAALQLANRPQFVGDLAFSGPDGGAMSLADFSGRTTLLNLWATWCAPCRREMPALDRLQQARGGEDFAVAAVSVDSGDAEKPKAFLQSIGVAALPFYADPSTDIFNELKKRSLAVGLPVTLLVDPRGCLIGHMNGPAEWDSEDARRLIEAAVAPAAPAS